ncbi:hypothetical protein CPB84DRAFT_1878713 [Gymnopilus junonius]|uniref:Uncharacterized protein n=1 Tax=Gymnopilus junonius TaxID=109634 RepID=A0A9P5NWX5_GYMJU|nr:hypothetical protein CPB84DRAFT_1878713 [Gymnopilus junonius]
MAHAPVGVLVAFTSTNLPFHCNADCPPDSQYIAKSFTMSDISILNNQMYLAIFCSNFPQFWKGANELHAPSCLSAMSFPNLSNHPVIDQDSRDLDPHIAAEVAITVQLADVQGFQEHQIRIRTRRHFGVTFPLSSELVKPTSEGAEKT